MLDSDNKSKSSIELIFSTSANSITSSIKKSSEKSVKLYSEYKKELVNNLIVVFISPREI